MSNSTQVNPPHNIDAYLVGTAEFSFSLDAASRAETILKGWRDFGNLQAVKPNTEGKKLEHFGSFRGKRRKDREVNVELKHDYELKGDQFTYEEIKLLVFGEDLSDVTQSALTLSAADSLAFTSPIPASTKNWYDVKVSDVRVRRATQITVGTSPKTAVTVDNTTERVTHTAHGFSNGQAVIFTATVIPAGLTAGQVYYVVNKTTDDYQVAATVGGAAINITSNGTAVFDQAALVEGTDYFTDLVIGRIKFAAAQTATIYLNVSCPAIAAGDANYFKTITPLTQNTRKGYGRLLIFDQNTNELLWDHQDFSCTVTISGAPDVDGTKWSDWSMMISVTLDTGVLAIRNANLNV